MYINGSTRAITWYRGAWSSLLQFALEFSANSQGGGIDSPGGYCSTFCFLPSNGRADRKAVSGHLSEKALSLKLLRAFLAQVHQWNRLVLFFLSGTSGSLQNTSPTYLCETTYHQWGKGKCLFNGGLFFLLIARHNQAERFCHNIHIAANCIRYCMSLQPRARTMSGCSASKSAS